MELSIVIPVYNDEEVLAEMHRRLSQVLPGLAGNYEVLFIDDGSRDGSFKVLKGIARLDRHVQVIRLTRNFGQQSAIAAGMDHAKGEIVVIMDSDLQDRPEDIHLLLEAMERDDTDLAIAKWVTRKDSFLKRFYSRLFFNLSRKITHLKIEPGLGVFRAIRRNAVEQINGIPEKTGTILSLMYWAGMDYSVVKMERDKRHAGSSGYTFTRMLGLAAERIFSYSIFPIRLASYFGLIIGGASLVYGVYLILRHFIFDDLAQGWTSTMVTLSFLFGINFIFLGIIGEYLGRIFLEAKGRPKYMVGKIIRYDNEE